MPITFTDTEAVFSGECQVAEADALYEWLQRHPEGRVRLDGCVHFHAALLQVLMATRARIIEQPDAIPLARWIVGTGGVADSPWAEPVPPPLVVLPEEPPVVEVRPQAAATRTRRKSAPSMPAETTNTTAPTASSPAPRPRTRRGTTPTTRKPQTSKDDTP